MKYFLVTLIVFIVFTNAQKVKKGYPNLKATSEINHMVSEVEEQVRAVLDYPDDGEKFKALFYRFKFDIIPFLKGRKPTKGTTYFVKVRNFFQHNHVNDAYLFIISISLQ